MKRLLNSVITLQKIMFRLLAGTRLCVALATPLLMATPCYSYMPETHAEIAKAAFQYIYERLAEDPPGTTYGYNDQEQWTSIRDYEIALQWMGVKPGDTQKTIQDRYTFVLNQLAKGASKTDFYRDIWFKYKEWYVWPFFPDCTNEIDNHNYTSLSHFLLMHWTQGDLWRVPGYTYELSNRDGLDKTAFDFLATLGGVEVATACGYPDKYRKAPSLLDPKQYDENWKRALKHIRFPPATAMTWYHYNVFLSSEASGIRPSDTGILELGPVLHAVHDVTVPHYVIGVLGYGHEDYETLIKQFVAEIIDRKRVRNFLSDSGSHQGPGWDTIRSALQTQQDLNVILEKLCEYVLLYEEHPPNGIPSRYDGDNDRYNPEIDFYNDNMERARELLNLAIAANVVILRKAIHDWPNHGKLQLPTPTVKPESPGGAPSARVVYTENSELTVADFLPSSWLDRISESSRATLSSAIASALGLFDVRNQASEVKPQMEDTLADIECRLITALDGILIEHNWITSQHLGEGYSMNAKEIAYLNREPHFRDPPREVITSNSSWKQYKGQKDSFKKRFVGIQTLLKKSLMQTSAIRSGYFPHVTFAEMKPSEELKYSDPCDALYNLTNDYEKRLANSDKSLRSLRVAHEEETEKYNKTILTIQQYENRPGEGTEKDFRWNPWQKERENRDVIYNAYQQLDRVRKNKESIQSEIARAEYERRRIKEDLDDLSSIKDDLATLGSFIKKSLKHP